MSPSDDFTAARKALQDFVRAHVAADRQLEVSRLIASYVAASVRRDRASQTALEGLATVRRRLDQFMRKAQERDR